MYMCVHLCIVWLKSLLDSQDRMLGGPVGGEPSDYSIGCDIIYLLLCGHRLKYLIPSELFNTILFSVTYDLNFLLLLE